MVEEIRCERGWAHGRHTAEGLGDFHHTQWHRRTRTEKYRKEQQRALSKTMQVLIPWLYVLSTAILPQPLAVEILPECIEARLRN